MTNAGKVQINLFIPHEHRDQLRRLAAKRMLENPREMATAPQVAAEIIGQYLEGIKIFEEEVA